MVEARTTGEGVDVDKSVTSTELATVTSDDMAAGVDVAMLVMRTVLTTVIGTAGTAAPVVPADETGATDEVMTIGEKDVMTLVTVTGAAAGRAVVITTDETEYNVFVTVTGAAGASDVVTVRADVDSNVFVTVKGAAAGVDVVMLEEAVVRTGREAAGTGADAELLPVDAATGTDVEVAELLPTAADGEVEEDISEELLLAILDVGVGDPEAEELIAPPDVVGEDVDQRGARRVSEDGIHQGGGGKGSGEAVTVVVTVDPQQVAMLTKD